MTAGERELQLKPFMALIASDCCETCAKRRAKEEDWDLHYKEFPNFRDCPVARVTGPHWCGEVCWGNVDDGCLRHEGGPGRPVDWREKFKLVMDIVWPQALKHDLAPKPLDRKQVEVALEAAHRLKEDMTSYASEARQYDDDFADKLAARTARMEAPKGIMIDAKRQGLCCSSCDWFEPYNPYPMSIGAWVFMTAALGAAHKCPKGGK